MFNFNNNKKENDLPQPDLQELFQRLEHLERKCHRLDVRVAELEVMMAEKTKAQEEEIAVKIKENTVGIEENTPRSSFLDAPSSLPETPSSLPETPSSLLETPSSLPESPSSRLLTPDSRLLYLAAPTPDGVFLQASETEQIGKSIYQLTTTDGQNGTFILLDTPDAIATAMISVSQFVKPACKVSGNTAIQPRHIITEEEGAASREGTGWKITRKAVVHFE